LAGVGPPGGPVVPVVPEVQMLASTRTKLLFGTPLFLIAIQLVPYGRNHTNPPVAQEPAWDSPATRELARRACVDCHTNETRWPAYSSVAPSSWLVQNDVDSGRRHLNFSEWNKPQRHAKDAADQVRTKEMPLWYYTLLHPASKLTDSEREQLAAGLERTMGKKEN
jgi:mono/diheme cytochrome c family protein